MNEFIDFAVLLDSELLWYCRKFTMDTRIIAFLLVQLASSRHQK
jgi:hypothetical protein